MAKSTNLLNKVRDISHGYETDAENSHKHLRLWLRLLTCTILVENEIRSRLKDAFDETLAQFDLMAQLDRRPAGLTMSELSQRLMVTNGNITGLVDRLIRRKLVERIPSSTDRRILIVVLTPTGKLQFRIMAAKHERWIKELFGDISTHGIGNLMKLLTETRESVRGAIARSRKTDEESRAVRQRKQRR